LAAKNPAVGARLWISAATADSERSAFSRLAGLRHCIWPNLPTNSPPQNIQLIVIIAINMTTNAPIIVVSFNRRRNVVRFVERMRRYSFTALAPDFITGSDTPQTAQRTRASLGQT
jgi:hypothetical protein